MSSSANDEMVRSMVYENMKGVSSVGEKRGGDQCDECQ